MALRALQGPTGGGAPVGGTGITNTIPRWTGPSTLGDSVLVQSGTNAVGFGTPKTWGTNFTLNAIQLSESASLSADINTTYLAANQYWDSPGFQNRRIKANFAARYLLNGASGDHQFQIAPFGAADSAITWSTAMTILNTSGNVGIGTASPTDSGGWSAGRILDVRSGSVGTSAVIYVGDSGRATNTQLGFYGLGYGFVGTVTNHAFRILQNNALRGEWTTTSLDISATSGYGIKLQGTAGTNNTDPNVLDFYADGGTANSGGVTWTPTISFGGASTGITYQTQVGRYTRVGNMVFATCYVVLTSKGTATGNVKITGLPTSSNTTSLFTGATVGYFANITSTGQVMGYMSPNDTGIILNQTTAAGANTALTDVNFANNSAIIVTIAYPVT